MNINRCFEILEISSDSTYEEAKAAYRLMCQVWHPDKYNHSERLHAKASSKIKEINAAWNQIEDYFKNVASSEAEARESERRQREERESSQRTEQERKRSEAENANKHNQQLKHEQQTSQTLYTSTANKSLSSITKIVFSIIAVIFVVAMFSGKKKDTANVPVPTPTSLSQPKLAPFTGELDPPPQLKPFTGITMLNNGLNEYSRSGKAIGPQWARNANIAGISMTLNETKHWVHNLNHLGYSDWRLPTKDELDTFAKLGGKNPSDWLNANGFNNVKPNSYWSANTGRSYPNGAWIVDMGSGDVYDGNGFDSHYVWPVRDGQ